MKEVQMPPIEPWQRSVLDGFLARPNNTWHIVKSIRQCGKSILAEYMLIYASLNTPSSVSLSVSPVISQSRKLYEDINTMAAKLIKKANGALLEITFINGSKIIFKSGEQKDSIRGVTCKNGGILVVDEAAYIKDDLFFSVLVPTTNVFHNDIFIFSTPKFKKGFFYELYATGLNDQTKCVSYDWTNYDLSKYLDNDTLEIYRKQLPRTAFDAEFRGMFIDGDGAVFSDFKRCIGEFDMHKENELYITIDWACGNGGASDSTAISIGQLAGNKIGINDIIAFNDKKPKETIEYIKELVSSYVSIGYKNINIICEKNSIGNVYFSILKDALDQFEQAHNQEARWQDEIEINLQTFLTTNESKKKLVEHMETLFENELIILPDNNKLITQLSMFEATVNKNGTIIYGTQPTEHDDMVMSMGFLIEALWNEIE